MDREHVWEVTTVHGTRILIDPGEESRWMRIPVIGDDGRLNLHPLDGRWRRLWTAYPIDCRGRRGGFDIEVGKPLRIHIGINEWWDTTTVVAVRALSGEEIPSPLPSTLDDAP